METGAELVDFIQHKDRFSCQPSNSLIILPGSAPTYVRLCLIPLRREPRRDSGARTSGSSPERYFARGMSFPRREDRQNTRSGFFRPASIYAPLGIQECVFLLSRGRSDRYREFPALSEDRSAPRWKYSRAVPPSNRDKSSGLNIPQQPQGCARTG